MAEKPCNCPVCNRPGAYRLTEEVDIGVGIQPFTVGYECEDCGFISVCAGCGAVGGNPCASWCPYHQSLQPTEKPNNQAKVN